MNMIGHKAVGPDGNLTPRIPLRHKSYVHRIVVLAEKGLLPAVSSSSYRMGVSPLLPFWPYPNSYPYE
jgi:hypothetical protein